jgi:LysR family transcriptional regulator, flagellar master operon regulator
LDILLAQTFLEVAAAGSLARASERLHVTQAAVSARLQALEELLNQRLFVRNKAGARLTAAGRAFFPYATQLTQVWDQAKLKVAAHGEKQAALSLGGEFSLWSALLINWLVALRQSRHGVVLRTLVGQAEHLLEQVQNGTLDLAVVYSPHGRPGIETSLLLEEELVAVSTMPHCTRLDFADYVYVDWGPDFRAQHDHMLPELRDANTVIALGPLALRYILSMGGTGYFRTRAVEPHLRTGALHRVDGAPMFSYAMHAAFSGRTDPELLAWAIGCLRQVAQTSLDNWA